MRAQSLREWGAVVPRNPHLRRRSGLRPRRPRLAKRQGLTTPFHFGRRAFALSGYAGDASVLVQLHISEIAAIPCLVMRLGHAQGNARDPGQGGESSGGEGRFFHIASITTMPQGPIDST